PLHCLMLDGVLAPAPPNGALDRRVEVRSQGDEFLSTNGKDIEAMAAPLSAGDRGRHGPVRVVDPSRARARDRRFPRRREERPGHPGIDP
ncbi:MAG: hypothetical protein ACREA0_05015, partial [bacterium]